MPDEPGPHKGVFETFINTHKADTLEELARKIKVDPKTFVATVKRYNQIVAQARISTLASPLICFIRSIRRRSNGIHRTVRLSAVCSGLLVNENHQCLDADAKPIMAYMRSAISAAASTGGVDYPLTVFGMSLGRCYTFRLSRWQACREAVMIAEELCTTQPYNHMLRLRMNRVATAETLRRKDSHD